MIWEWLIIIVLLLVQIVALFFIISLMISTFSAAPYVPLSKKNVRRMLELARIKPGQIHYDLGSGDGRVVVMAAQEFGALSRGIELSFFPYLVSRLKIFLKRLSGKVKVRFGDLYKADFSEAEVVTMYLMPKAMPKIKAKLQQELKPGSKVVSAAFEITGWQPLKVAKPTERAMPIYLYKI